MAIGLSQGPAAAPQATASSLNRARFRPGRPGAIAMFLAVLAIILIACGGGSSDSESQMPSISSGSGSEVSDSKDLAPNFSFTLFQGVDSLGAGVTDLSQLRGKPLIINFWAGLCPPCRAEMPDLQKFYEGAKDQVTLLGIDIGQFTGLGNRQDARELLEELGITYPVGYTSDASVIKNYKVLGMPTTVFIDARGEIAKTWTGALNESVLIKQTDNLLGR